jgi:hypothetical protein
MSSERDLYAQLSAAPSAVENDFALAAAIARAREDEVVTDHVPALEIVAGADA